MDGLGREGRWETSVTEGPVAPSGSCAFQHQEGKCGSSRETHPDRCGPGHGSTMSKL